MNTGMDWGSLRLALALALPLAGAVAIWLTGRHPVSYTHLTLPTTPY